MHRRSIAGTALVHFLREQSGMVAVMVAADGLQALEAQQFRLAVVAQAARIGVVDVFQCRAPGQDIEQLIDLLLVLDDGVANLGVLENVHQLLRHRVLVQRHRDAAQRLRRGQRPVQARPVGADDGQMVAAFESLLSQTAGKRPDFGRHLAPGPGLPDAVVFFADRRPVGARPSVCQQQARERLIRC